VKLLIAKWADVNTREGYETPLELTSGWVYGYCGTSEN